MEDKVTTAKIQFLLFTRLMVEAAEVVLLEAITLGEMV
jgi:hypothetical protein